MTKHLIFAAFAIISLSMIALSCSKDESFNNSKDESLELTKRSSQPLQVSYDLTEISQINPDNGRFQDMCIGDIRMLNELTKLYQVTSTITNTGNPCIEVVKSVKSIGNNGGSVNKGTRGQREGYDYKSTSKYCDRVLTYVTKDTTITKSVTVNLEFWKSVIQGYLYTEKEVKQSFVTMIETHKQNGAVVTTDGKTISVTNTTSTGEEITSVYNTETNVLLYNEIKDANGVVKKTVAYEYACSPDGKVIPKSILINTTEKSSICKTPFVKSQWKIFDNYSVSI